MTIIWIGSIQKRIVYEHSYTPKYYDYLCMDVKEFAPRFLFC